MLVISFPSSNDDVHFIESILSIRYSLLYLCFFVTTFRVLWYKLLLFALIFNYAHSYVFRLNRFVISLFRIRISRRDALGVVHRRVALPRWRQWRYVCRFRRKWVCPCGRRQLRSHRDCFGGSSARSLRPQRCCPRNEGPQSPVYRTGCPHFVFRLFRLQWRFPKEHLTARRWGYCGASCSQHDGCCLFWRSVADVLRPLPGETVELATRVKRRVGQHGKKQKLFSCSAIVNRSDGMREITLVQIRNHASLKTRLKFLPFQFDWINRSKNIGRNEKVHKR